jgi:hypothetical protein
MIYGSVGWWNAIDVGHATVRLDRREPRISNNETVQDAYLLVLPTRRLLTLREAVVLNDNLLATSYGER